MFRRSGKAALLSHLGGFLLPGTYQYFLLNLRFLYLWSPLSGIFWHSNLNSMISWLPVLLVSEETHFHRKTNFLQFLPRVCFMTLINSFMTPITTAIENLLSLNCKVL